MSAPNRRMKIPHRNYNLTASNASAAPSDPQPPALLPPNLARESPTLTSRRLAQLQTPLEAPAHPVTTSNTSTASSDIAASQSLIIYPPDFGAALKSAQLQAHLTNPTYHAPNRLIPHRGYNLTASNASAAPSDNPPDLIAWDEPSLATPSHYPPPHSHNRSHHRPLCSLASPPTSPPPELSLSVAFSSSHPPPKLPNTGKLQTNPKAPNLRSNAPASHSAPSAGLINSTIDIHQPSRNLPTPRQTQPHAHPKPFDLRDHLSTPSTSLLRNRPHERPPRSLASPPTSPPPDLPRSLAFSSSRLPPKPPNIGKPQKHLEGALFVSNTQDSSLGLAHNALLFKQTIGDARAPSAAPAVLCFSELESIRAFEGFCLNGHKIYRRSLIKPGKSQACSFCAAFFVEDIFTCHCYAQFACLQCLSEHRTNPPPPRCPAPLCNGECIIRFKPIATVCSSGSHAIRPNVKAWHCPMLGCTFIVCEKCSPTPRQTQPHAHLKPFDLRDHLSTPSTSPLRNRPCERPPRLLASSPTSPPPDLPRSLAFSSSHLPPKLPNTGKLLKHSKAPKLRGNAPASHSAPSAGLINASIDIHQPSRDSPISQQAPPHASPKLSALSSCHKHRLQHRLRNGIPQGSVLSPSSFTFASPTYNYDDDLPLINLEDLLYLVPPHLLHPTPHDLLALTNGRPRSYGRTQDHSAPSGERSTDDHHDRALHSTLPHDTSPTLTAPVPFSNGSDAAA
jgi:hypothetical protein